MTRAGVLTRVGSQPGAPGITLPVISPSLGQIPRDLAPLPERTPRNPRNLALPARPPLGISPSPPNDTVQGIFLYLDAATKTASEIWFGNLFDNEFARVRANSV